MRENAEEKAVRLLTTGRVTITGASHRFVAGVVRGDHGTYWCGYDRGSWHCECPCLTGCSHVAALKRICDPLSLADRRAS